MKTKIYKLFFIVLLGFGASNVFAQNFEMQLIENQMGYLEVQAREITGLVPTTSTNISQITFEIRWLSTLGADVTMICSNSNYNLVDGLGSMQTTGSYNWRNFVANPIGFPYPNNWTLNVWETIATFKVTGTGTGAFEIAPAGWVSQTLQWQDALAAPRTITLVGSVASYTFPTLIYDLVWVGGGSPIPGTWDEESWTYGGNWVDECGSAVFTGPLATENVFIPGGNTYYPTNGAINPAFVPAALDVKIGTGGSISWNDPNGTILPISGNLDNYGTVSIKPNNGITVNGSTHIENANGLVVEADATGVGSFVNDLNGPGTPITYGASGSAKVQTYISNGAAVNSFYMHLMGPTVDEASYTGPGTGAFLQAFDVAPGNTFAYSWSEPANAWVNQFSYTYPVQTTDGIGLSTDDATAYTMDMTGALMYGNIPSRTLTYTTSHYEMLSNPYPSAFEFDAFSTSGSNATVILGKNWQWDPVGGSYIAYVNGSSQMIQVGQAFFVETTPAAGAVTFYNINRNHSNVPFRNTKTNWLTLDITGGDYGYYDQTVIRFLEDGTTGYDLELEAIKWNSMYTNATQIRSIAEDGTELSVNTMPQLDLQGEMVSVPVHFECGFDGEYTFTASDVESFESGTEIWIEDKQDGNSWHHLSIGHETYTFTASPDDASDRFIVHFFGPTAVEEVEANNVLIYSDNEYALIRNMTNNEVVKEVYIYSLAGSMILHKQVPEQNMYRFFVSNYDNYYIVRVVTDKNIYTEKVFVH